MGLLTYLRGLFQRPKLPPVTITSSSWFPKNAEVPAVQRYAPDDLKRIQAMLAESDDRVPFGAADTMPFDLTVPADLDAILPKR